MALYAAAQVGGVRGLFRSIDAGQTWVRINDDQHQWGHAGETAITGDPRTFGRVYVGTNGRAASSTATGRETQTMAMFNRPKLIACVTALALVAVASRAQTVAVYKATLSVRADQPRWTINRDLYASSPNNSAA
jgi:photosystem II stability/assembly factor-like uncharacterized protein